MKHFLDSVRTPRASAVISCVLGIVMVAFGSCALLMVVLQCTLLSVMPPIPQDAQGIAFMRAIDAIHGVWAIYMPLMIAGGLTYAITGFRLLYGSEFARRLAQINAVLGYVWLAAYAVSCYHLMPIFEKLWGPVPGPVGVARSTRNRTGKASLLFKNAIDQ